MKSTFFYWAIAYDWISIYRRDLCSSFLNKNVFAMTQNTQNAIHTKTTLKPQMQNTFFILFDLDFAVQCFQFFRINSPGEAFNRTV